MVQNGYVDDVPVERIKEYQTKLTEFLTTCKSDVLATILKQQTLDDALTAQLKSVAEEFKSAFPIGKAQPEKTKTAESIK